MYDVPFWVYIISIPVVLGMITGFTAGLFWRQRFKYVERQLETLVKEQKLPSVKANYKEVIMIEKYIEKLYKKNYVIKQNYRKNSLPKEQRNVSKAYKKSLSKNEIV